MDRKDKKIEDLRDSLVKVCNVVEELCTELEGEGYYSEFEELINKVRDVIRATDDTFYD